jgi:hypothetical protein
VLVIDVIAHEAIEAQSQLPADCAKVLRKAKPPEWSRQAENLSWRPRHLWCIEGMPRIEVVGEMDASRLCIWRIIPASEEDVDI